MNPLEAANLAAELSEHMLTLAELDARPIANARQITIIRREAMACASLLTGYLNTSDAFDAPLSAVQR